MCKEQRSFTGIPAIFLVFVPGTQKDCGRAGALSVSVSGTQKDCVRAVVLLVSVSGTQKDCGCAVALLYLYQEFRKIVGAQWSCYICIRNSERLWARSGSVVSVSGTQKDCGRALALLVSVSGTQKDCGRAVAVLYLYQERREIVGAQWHLCICIRITK